jgi:capsular polysaccharide biosynthesis protein
LADYQRGTTISTQQTDSPVTLVSPASAKSPPNLGEAIRQNWIVVAVSTAAFVAMALLVSNARTPVYAAQSTVSVGGVEVSQTNFLTSGGPAQSLAAVFSRALSAPAVRAGVAKRLGAERGQFVGALAGTPVPDSNLFRIEAESTSARKAVALANAAADEIIAYAAQLRQDADARLLDQLRQASYQLKASRRRVAGFLARKTSPQGAVDQARVEASIADLRFRSLSAAFRREVQSSGTGALQRFSSAAGASSDQQSKTQFLVLLGLITGAFVGSALAFARSLRRHRRSLD